MKNILVTGAASGIGRCFAEHYLSQPDYYVFAVDRNPINIASADEGFEVRLTKLQCDFADEASIRTMAGQLGTAALDIVVHSAGVRGLMTETAGHRQETTHRETYEVMDNATMMRTFAVNTAGTFTLLQSIMPQLRQASLHGAPAKVLVMSSRMGSISYNTAQGGGYAYRASKAALNAVIKSFSIDVPEVVFTMVHPGRVETGLVEFKEAGAMTIAESVRDMLKLMNVLRREDSGRFVDRFGETIDW